MIRRQLVSLAVAAMAVIATPLGAGPMAEDRAAVPPVPTVAVQQVNLSFPALRDEAAMVLVGTALIVLAAAVRRAV